MRWFWRADLPTLAVDGLLEGSLVGVAYMALVPFTQPKTELPLAAFWLAAAAGLAVGRLSSRWLRLEDSVPLLVVLAGVVGFRFDGGVGWLLGAALLRGALHIDAQHESDVSVDAVTYALPVIAFALLMRLGSGAPFVGPILITSLVCLVAGMIAIGRGRQREFESVGPVAQGRSTWLALAVGLAALTAVAIPVAYLVGTATLSIAYGPAVSIAAAGRSLLDVAVQSLDWFLSLFTQVLPRPEIPPLPTPAPAGSPRPVPPPAQVGGATDTVWLTLLIVALALVVPVLVASVILFALRRLFGWRQALPRAQLPASPPAAREHPPSALARARAGLSRPRQLRRKSVQPDPTSAAEAYLALLDELADRGELARRPTETPRHHARRVGGQGLDPLPLALLAADYQLASYGQVAVTERETARALARWRRLRALVQQPAPPREDRGGAGGGGDDDDDPSVVLRSR